LHASQPNSQSAKSAEAKPAEKQAPKEGKSEARVFANEQELRKEAATFAKRAGRVGWVFLAFSLFFLFASAFTLHRLWQLHQLAGGVAKAPYVLATMSDLGFDPRAPRDERRDIVWKDLADMSGDPRMTLASIDMQWSEVSTLFVGNLPVGPVRRTLTITITTPAESLSEDEERRVIKQFLRDVVKQSEASTQKPTRAPSTGSQGPLFSEQLDYELRVKDPFQHASNALLSSERLTRAKPGVWTASRRGVNGAFAGLFFGRPTPLVFFVVSAIWGFRLLRKARAARKGCFRCGYPLAVRANDAARAVFEVCSECGHDSMRELTKRARWRRKQAKERKSEVVERVERGSAGPKAERKR
jgi:hypothetical protein